MQQKIVGAWGERLAQQYLEKHAYQILETNWRYHQKEIDIIAYKDKIIAVEVKTRRGLKKPPQTILKAAQVGRLRQALLAYCRGRGLNYENSDLSLIIVTILPTNLVKINHYPQI